MGKRFKNRLLLLGNAKTRWSKIWEKNEGENAEEVVQVSIQKGVLIDFSIAVDLLALRASGQQEVT